MTCQNIWKTYFDISQNYKSQHLAYNEKGSDNLSYEHLSRTFESLKETDYSNNTQIKASFREKYINLLDLGGVISKDDLFSETSSFIMLRFPGQTFKTGKNFSVQKATYFYLYADNIKLNDSTTISASGAGCSTVIPKIDSNLSKYQKVCKVRGGSHIGRGTLGKGVNLELCKFLIPKTYPIGLYDKVLSGQGGQKSHQVQATNSNGHGGGIINIYAKNKLEIKNKFESNGGQAELKEYNMIAGGAGGTIKLSSSKIEIILDPDWQNSEKVNFAPQFSVKGGDPDIDLGAGGGGKILINCLAWDVDPHCIKLSLGIPMKKTNPQNILNDTRLDYALSKAITTKSGKFDEIPDIPQYYMTMHMFEKVRNFIFNGALINLNPCLPGAGGPLCRACKPGFYKSTIDHSYCIPCPCIEELVENEQPELIKDALISEKYGTDNIDGCVCKVNSKTKSVAFQLGGTFIVFIIMMSFFYLIMRKKKKYEDKNFLSKIRYKTNDIPNSLGRVFVSGSNIPSQPWKIDRLNSELSKYFDVPKFSKFREVSIHFMYNGIILIGILRVESVVFFNQVLSLSA